MGLLGVQLDADGFVVLDSSTPAKFSKHVIIHRLTCGELVFANNAQVGLVVRKFVEYARKRKDEPGFARPGCLFVRAKSSSGDVAVVWEDSEMNNCIVDESVYSRNRCFRLLFHSKFQKGVPLWL